MTEMTRIASMVVKTAVVGVHIEDQQFPQRATTSRAGPS